MAVLGIGSIAAWYYIQSDVSKVFYVEIAYEYDHLLPEPIGVASRTSNFQPDERVMSSPIKGTRPQ